MRTIETVAQMREQRGGGFVPTMGALHAGHLKLVERARAENASVTVSIFVNPTQFNDPRDLEKYPRTLERDVDLLRAAGVDTLFLPNYAELYVDQYRYEVREKEFSRELCGENRPGHFEGMLTVVMKLFNVVRPERAYFGEKDFQQLSLVRDMVRAFFLDVEVVAVPTARAEDGLALSSRNARLTTQERALAPRLYEALKTAPTCADARLRLEAAGFEVDYVTDTHGRRFAAARLGAVRLIDNV